MKVERISENQLKLTLTKEDLKEREITLEDLLTPSEKTQSLFRDLMEQVLVVPEARISLEKVMMEYRYLVERILMEMVFLIMMKTETDFIP